MKKTGRTLIAGLMTVLIMVMFMVPAALTAQAASGDEMTISSKAELESFRDDVNGGNSYLGMNVILTADISLAGESWEPIGTMTAKFEGTFTATGYKINYITIPGTGNNVGLFGNISGATIIGVDARHAQISGNDYVGIICANAENSTISNCVSTGTVSGNSRVGGIVGNAGNTSITGCTASVTISGGSRVGGIAGETYHGSIQSSTNTASTISGTDNIGGICGYSNGTTFTGSTNAATSLTGGTNTGDIYGYEKTVVAAAIEGANWIDSADTSWYSALGVYEFTLTTAAQLAGLAELVNNGTDSFMGKIVRLGNDISLNSGVFSVVDGAQPRYNGAVITAQNMPTAWTPIGKVNTQTATATPFKGTFDGQDYAISGVYMNNSIMFQGLFGMLDAASVTNVVLRNSFIGGGDVLGGICANAENGTEITDCTLEAGAIVANAASNTVGGICGDTEGYNGESAGAIITGCVNVGKVGGRENVGGIVGIQSGTAQQDLITNCSSSVTQTVGENEYTREGFVYGTTTIGGIAGSAVNITNSHNAGEVLCEGSVAGGIAGISESITDCTNSGKITASYCTGGITAVNDGTVLRASNTGKINGSNVTGGIVGSNKGTVQQSDNSSSINASDYVGGIVGYNLYFREISTQTEYTGTVTDCDNNAAINGRNDIGGIAGYNNSLINQSDNSGAITGTERVGGITGTNYYSDDSITLVTATIDDCNNSATVGHTGSAVAGGIAGSSTGDITNCINGVSATVDGSMFVGGIVGDGEGAEHCENNATVGTAMSSVVGGIAGSGSDEFHYCANNGSVAGEEYVGGICGTATQQASYCFNNGDIAGIRQVGGIMGYSDGGNIANCVNSEDASVNGTDNVGGIIGYGGTNTVTLSTNAAEVNGTNNVGGIAGYSYTAEVDDCINNGEVVGSSYVGGVLGHNETGTIHNSFNEVQVSGEAQVGGIVGSSRVGEIEGCYNTGAVDGGTNGDSIGGIVGFATQSLTSIILCYNDAQVIGKEAVGGILGNEDEGSIFVEDCYNKGNVTGTQDVGGLIGSGSDYNMTIVQNNFSIGEISGTTNVGGAVGIINETPQNEISGGEPTESNALEELIASGIIDDAYYEAIIGAILEQGDDMLIDNNYHMAGTVSGSGNIYSTELPTGEFTDGTVAWLLNTRGGEDANGEYTNSGKWAQNTVSPQFSSDSYFRTYRITITGDYEGSVYTDSQGKPISLPHGYSFTLNGASFTSDSVVTQAETIVAHAHHYVWTTNNDGTHSGVCSCGATITENCEYASEITAPTCESGGFTTHTCVDCGYVLIDTTTNALGHTLEWTTVEGEDYQVERCTVCARSFGTRNTPQSELTRTVTFAGMFGKVLSKQQVNVGETVEIPEPADVAGYTFKGWSTDANSAGNLSRAGELRVSANYEWSSSEYTVTVNGESRQYAQYDMVTASAAQTNNGESFSYWTDEEGRIVSYYASYTFRVHTDTSLTAVYGETPEKPHIAARVTKLDYSSYYDYLTVYVERSVGPEYTVVQHGMLVTDDTSIGGNDVQFKIGEDGTPEGVSRTTESGGLTGLYTLSFNNLSSYDTIIYMRSYVKVTDGNEMFYVYSAVTTYINPANDLGPAIIESGTDDEIICATSTMDTEQEVPADVQPDSVEPEEIQQFEDEEVDQIETQQSLFAKIISFIISLFNIFSKKA